MELIIALIIFSLLWNTRLGRFVIGNLAKIMYTVIAITICMAIPIPLVNILVTMWIVGAIWASKIG